MPAIEIPVKATPRRDQWVIERDIVRAARDLITTNSGLDTEACFYRLRDLIAEIDAIPLYREPGTDGEW